MRVREHPPSKPSRDLYYRGMSCASTKNLGWFSVLVARSRQVSGKRAMFSAVVGAAFWAWGCQAPGQPEGPTEMVLCIPDHEAFVEASLSVLRRHDFPPEYVDRAHGVVITQPATSGQWFEFWRRDSQGAYQGLEASLHTMRRVVTVSVEPTGGEAPDEYRLAVRVDKSRYSAPERQVTTASGALGIYNERLPTTEGLRAARTRDAHWVPMGRDALLEEYLLGRLAAAVPAEE